MSLTMEPVSSPEKIIDYLKQNEIQLVDLRFTDLFGTWQHLTVPMKHFGAQALTEGIGFDGSSIRGFQVINESDMLLKPDPDTVFIDCFSEHPTAAFICSIVDPMTGQRYEKDPRYIASKAEEYMRKSGIADTAYFGPEAEFFLFDKIRYECTPRGAFYEIDSEEAYWNSGYQGGLGLTMKPKSGYFPCQPVDRLHDVRSEMVLKLIRMGIEVEMHHHEVAGAGQCEIDMKYDKMCKIADKLQLYKYVVRNTAAENGLLATFMPKPIYDDNGSGMHIHMSLWKEGKNLMYGKEGYGGLSDLARWFVGGIIKHSAALLAFCAPTTNSYRRLVPGFEAPINLIYSSRNRSACIRVPMYSESEKSKRIEFRAPDPTANPYLAFSACLMAGLDGIENKIEPPKPVDKDLYELPASQARNIKQTPTSLRDCLMALKADQKFLLKGDVFNKEVIDSYIDYKLHTECDAVDSYPHPYEFYLYADA